MGLLAKGLFSKTDYNKVTAADVDQSFSYRRRIQVSYNDQSISCQLFTESPTILMFDLFILTHFFRNKCSNFADSSFLNVNISLLFDR